MGSASCSRRVFRFAPSPNGYLHLGHAYSALLNQRLAQEAGGRLLLRIEDIDTTRCRPELIAAAMEDLQWLGLEWDAPPQRQSAEFPLYRAHLAALEDQGVVYPCFCSRKDIAGAVVAAEIHGAMAWPRDPDGVPHYPGTCRAFSGAARQRRIAAGEPHALRLDVARLLGQLGPRDLTWAEWGEGRVDADARIWGDVVLGRKDVPASYHLACVIDDDRQGITDVVRGRDLFHATAIQRLLQVALHLAEPRYRHHPLLKDGTGQKLAKSRASTPLRALRQAGWSAGDVRQHLEGAMPA